MATINREGGTEGGGGWGGATWRRGVEGGNMEEERVEAEKKDGI